MRYQKVISLLTCFVGVLFAIIALVVIVVSACSNNKIDQQTRVTTTHLERLICRHYRMAQLYKKALIEMEVKCTQKNVCEPDLSAWHEREYYNHTTLLSTYLAEYKKVTGELFNAEVRCRDE